jgi:carbonic anhydrase/acetyltransferase-like protein (isoleucine patch superfamily)
MIRRILFLIGRGIRETGQAMDRLGCRFQGNYAFLEPLSRHRRIQPLYNKKPLIGKETFIAPNAALIGQVELGNKSSVWYGAVLRGDVHHIKVGENSSIGDRVVIHVSRHGQITKGGSQAEPKPTLIGHNVTIEQGCIIHGATIADGALVAMGSVILDGAVVGHQAIVGPGSLVLTGQIIPDRQYWAGSPAKYVRDLTEQELQALTQLPNEYYQLARTHDEYHSLNEQQRYELRQGA